MSDIRAGVCGELNVVFFVLVMVTILAVDLLLADRRTDISALPLACRPTADLPKYEAR